MKKIAKTIIKLFEVIPEFDFNNKLSENINHKSFTDGDINFRNEKLFLMAKNHFLDNEEKPFETYFPGYNLESLFNNKIVLDLGCWCGGKSVSYAERWNVKEMNGMDVNKYFIDAAILFSGSRENLNIKYDFRLSFGESLPYPDNYFDGIVSYDVLEHVQSLDKTLREIKRVLKEQGLFFGVFPSYYTPGEHHMNFVTKMPFIHWMFSSKVLAKAYYEIIEERGEEAYWYKPEFMKTDWAKLNVGIGINGTTFSKFIKVCREVNFSNIKILPTPVYSVGKKALKHKVLKNIFKLFKPVVRIPVLREFMSHRIVCVLQK